MRNGFSKSTNINYKKYLLKTKKEYICYPSQYLLRQKGLVEALMNRKLWAGNIISCMRQRRRSSKFRSQALECKEKQLHFTLCKKGFSFIPNSCLECLHPVACVRSERVITPPEAETHHSTAKEEQIGTKTRVDVTPQNEKNSQKANNEKLET
jgi:hypothetical protein